MKAFAVTVMVLGLQSGGDIVAAQQPSPDSHSSAPDASADKERQDLVVAAQQAAGSPIDLVRALEAHLKKYPNSPYRERIIRSLFQASKNLGDQHRIAQFGEQLLAKDPDDVSVLAAVGTALNSFHDPKTSGRALSIGKQLEKHIRDQLASKEDEASGEKGNLHLQHAHDLAIALTIQADAYGTSGHLPEAIATAKSAFAAFPSAEAARSFGRWEAAANHNRAAIKAYADAFALEDSAGNHADDRRQLTELYLKQHKNTAGLGDIVLAEYDRMTALQEQMEPQSASTATARLTNNAILDMSGKQVVLGSFQGRVVVMDFWATWCHPCRVQHPLFEEVKNNFKSDPRVVFLEIDAGEDRATVTPFLQKQGWNSDAYLDNNLTRLLNIESIPTTVLLDRTSKVYSELVGFRPETFVALLTSRIEDALANDETKPSVPSQVN